MEKRGKSSIKFYISAMNLRQKPNSALEKRIKKHVIGKPHKFEAIVPLGFEDTLIEELKYIGVETFADNIEKGNIESTTENVSKNEIENALGNADFIKVCDGKVQFVAKITEAWKAVAYSRIANRVLMEIANFKAENFNQLEKHTAEIPWELFIEDSERSHISIHVTCKHSRLYHSDAVAERIQRTLSGYEAQDFKRENAPTANNKSQITHLFVRLENDRCSIWLDLAGEELYKRGHERFVAEAPLKETIAAAMIFEACKLQAPIQSELCERPHTPKQSDLITIVDPMAGSGTFSLEAAYIASGLIPGKCRDFALKHQPAFKEATWNFIIKAKDEKRKAQDADNRDCSESLSIIHIITSDISERPVSIIKHNVENSPLPQGIINPQLKDFFSYTFKDFLPCSQANNQQPLLFLNPPYGKRLALDAPKLYSKIGKKIFQWSLEAKACNASLIVAILVPKDCMPNLLKECEMLNPARNPNAKRIETSHGGFSLNAIFARI